MGLLLLVLLLSSSLKGIFLPSFVISNCRPPTYSPFSASHISNSYPTTFEGSACLIIKCNGTLHVPKCISESPFQISIVSTLSFRYLAKCMCSSGILLILGSISNIVVSPASIAVCVKLWESDYYRALSFTK